MGYDLNRFTKEPDQILICPICRKVLEDPVQLDCIRKTNDVASPSDDTCIDHSTLLPSSGSLTSCVSPENGTTAVTAAISITSKSGTSPNGDAIDAAAPATAAAISVSAKSTTVGTGASANVRKSSRRTSSQVTNVPSSSSSTTVNRSKKDGTNAFVGAVAKGSSKSKTSSTSTASAASTCSSTATTTTTSSTATSDTTKSSNVNAKSSTPGNLHVFCRSCIVDHFAESGGSSCPIDDEKFKRNTKRSLIQIPPQVILNALSSLEISCEFPGCSTVTTLNYLADHQEECPFKPAPVIKINLSCLTPSSTASTSTSGDYYNSNYHSTYSGQQQQLYSTGQQSKQQQQQLYSTTSNNNNPLQQSQQPQQVPFQYSQQPQQQLQQSPYSMSSVSSMYSSQQPLTSHGTPTASTSANEYYSSYYSSGNNHYSSGNYYSNSGNTPSTSYDEDDLNLTQRQQQQQLIPSQQAQQQQQSTLGYKRKKKHAHIYMEMDDKLAWIERRYDEKIELVRTQLHSRLEAFNMNQVQRLEGKYQKDIENLERNHRCQLVLFEEKIKNELDTMKHFIRSNVIGTSASSSLQGKSSTETSTRQLKKQGKRQQVEKSSTNANAVQFPDESSLTGSFFSSFGPVTETSLSLTTELQANLSAKVDHLCQAKSQELINLIKVETAKAQKELTHKQELFESKLLGFDEEESRVIGHRGKRNTRSTELSSAGSNKTAAKSDSNDSTIKSLKIQLNKCQEILKRTQEQVKHLQEQISTLEEFTSGEMTTSSSVTVAVAATTSGAVSSVKGQPGRKRKRLGDVTKEPVAKVNDENETCPGDDEDDADTVILTDTSVDGKIVTVNDKGQRGCRSGKIAKSAAGTLSRKKLASAGKNEIKSIAKVSASASTTAGTTSSMAASANRTVAQIRKKALGKATITMANIVSGKTRSSAVRKNVHRDAVKKDEVKTSLQGDASAFTPSSPSSSPLPSLGGKKNVKSDQKIGQRKRGFKKAKVEKSQPSSSSSLQQDASSDTCTTVAKSTDDNLQVEQANEEAKPVKITSKKRKGKSGPINLGKKSAKLLLEETSTTQSAPTPAKRAKVNVSSDEKGEKKTPGRKAKGANSGKLQLDKLRRSVRNQPIVASSATIKRELAAKSKGESGKKVPPAVPVAFCEEVKKGGENETITDEGTAASDNKGPEPSEGTDSRVPRRGCGFRGRGRNKLKSGSGASFPSARRGGVGVSRDATIDSSSLPPAPCDKETSDIQSTPGKDEATASATTGDSVGDTTNNSGTRGDIYTTGNTNESTKVATQDECKLESGSKEKQGKEETAAACDSKIETSASSNVPNITSQHASPATGTTTTPVAPGGSASHHLTKDSTVGNIHIDTQEHITSEPDAIKKNEKCATSETGICIINTSLIDTCSSSSLGTVNNNNKTATTTSTSTIARATTITTTTTASSSCITTTSVTKCAELTSGESKSGSSTNKSSPSNVKIGDDILRAAMDAIDDADQDDPPSIHSSRANILTNTNSLPLPPVASIAGKQFFASFPLSIPFSLPVVFGRVSTATATAANVTSTTATTTPIPSSNITSSFKSTATTTSTTLLGINTCSNVTVNTATISSSPVVTCSSSNIESATASNLSQVSFDNLHSICFLN